MDRKRRGLIKLLGSVPLLQTSAGILFSPAVMAKAKARVVIIGGGFGGATCANYIRQYDPSIEVTLVEQNSKFITCPFSNTILSGINNINYITRDYHALSDQRGIKVIHDKVVMIDPVAHKIMLKGKESLKYDHLIVSPGIDFLWNSIDGYDEAASQILPHAWKAGAQTLLLRKQIESMRDGGTVIIAPPANPFRAPPAPYERASLIAHYLKKNKPKSKILIVDASDDFAKQKLFTNAWQKFYPGMIEWVEGSKGGRIVRVDAKNKVVIAKSGERYKGDVINVIPPQVAGTVAKKAGLTNKKGWCAVDQKTFASYEYKDIHVIGDACIAGDMPKTGHSANSQAKVCAVAVVAALNGVDMPEPTYSSSIYSLIAPKYGVSMAAVYRLKNGNITQVSGGNSPLKARAKIRRKEAKFAASWYSSITLDAFGKKS